MSTSLETDIQSPDILGVGTFFLELQDPEICKQFASLATDAERRWMLLAIAQKHKPGNSGEHSDNNSEERIDALIDLFLAVYRFHLDRDAVLPAKAFAMALLYVKNEIICNSDIEKIMIKTNEFTAQNNAYAALPIILFNLPNLEEMECQ